MKKFFLILLILVSSCSVNKRGEYYNKNLDLPTFSVTLIKSDKISKSLSEKLFKNASKRIFNEIGVKVKLDQIITKNIDCPFNEVEICVWHLRDKLVKKVNIYSDIVYILKDWQDQSSLKESPIRGFAEQVGAVKYKFPSAAISYNQNIFWNDSAVMAHEIAHLLGASHKSKGIMKANNPYIGKDGGFDLHSIKEIHAHLTNKNAYASFSQSNTKGVIPLSTWGEESNSFFARFEFE